MEWCYYSSRRQRDLGTMSIEDIRKLPDSDKRWIVRNCYSRIDLMRTINSHQRTNTESHVLSSMHGHGFVSAVGYRMTITCVQHGHSRPRVTVAQL